MDCLNCGSKTSVIDSRKLETVSGIRRRRECKECGERITTYEVLDGSAPENDNNDKIKTMIRNEAKRILLGFFRTQREMTNLFNFINLKWNNGEANAGHYTLSTELRLKVFERDNFTCGYCKKTIEDGILLDVDHKIPQIKGGNDEMKNLITSCVECNRSKNDSIPSHL